MFECMEEKPPKPLRWVFDGMGSDLKARDEWKNSRGELCSGRIRYTISPNSAYWRIFLEGSHDSLAMGSCTDEADAKAQIEQWRLDHLEMPIWKMSNDGK